MNNFISKRDENIFIFGFFGILTAGLMLLTMLPF